MAQSSSHQFILLQVAIAFCRAMGCDEDEFDGLDDDPSQ